MFRNIKKSALVALLLAAGSIGLLVADARGSVVLAVLSVTAAVFSTEE